jgi:hypothetical protein
MANVKNFADVGADLADLEQAWKDRLADAQILVAAGRNASAIAMCLYTIEILLKTLICKKLDLAQLPKAFEIHDLDGLLVLAGLSRLNSQTTSPVKRNWDNILDASKQLNHIRYKPDQNWSAADSTGLLRQLEDPTDGVIAWLLNQS